MTTPTTVSVRLQLRGDTAANWTSVNPTLLANELGRETDTGKIKIGDGSTAWTSLAYQAWATLPLAVASGGTGQTTYTNGQLLIGNTTGNTLTKATLTAGSGIAVTNGTGSITVAASEIADSNISATAEIAVSKLADGAARQLLQTDAAGTGVEWTDNIDVPGTLDVTGAATFDSSVTVQGDLTVNGTTTTIDTQNLLVEDKNIIVGNVDTPTDTTADGGGITLKGATDKTLNWVDTTDSWTSSEHVDLASGKEYKINGTKVLDATSLGSAVVSSSLTSVGTIGTGTWQGTAIDAAYLDSTVVTTGDTGTVTSTMIADGTIVDADISATAEIAVSKLADGSARQLLQTDAAGTGVEWTDNVDIPGTLDVTGATKLDSTLSVPLGTAGAPTIHFGTDTNTGLYSPGADQVAISTNGTERVEFGTSEVVFNDGGNNYDFRIEGDTNSSLFFVDASTDRVGVGTTSPSALLHVEGGTTYINSTNAGGTSTPLQLSNAGTSGTSIVKLAFNNAGVTKASINAAVYGNDYLAFNTGSDTERARLDSSGRLGLGTSAPESRFQIGGGLTGSSATYPGVLQLNENPSTLEAVGGVEFKTSTFGSGYGWKIAALDSSGVHLQIGTRQNSATWSNVVRIDSSGRVGIGTTSPSAPLEIKAASNGVDTLLVRPSTGSNFLTFKPETASNQADIGYWTGSSWGTTKINAETFVIAGASEKLKVDTSGRLLVGTSTARTNLFNSTIAPAIQLEGAGIVPAQRFLSVINNYATAGDGGAVIALGRSKGGTVGSNTVVASNDQLGRFDFQGNDGTEFVTGAAIEGYVDGTPGADDMPGRLVFSTTADGASSPTERARITSGGYFKASNAGSGGYDSDTGSYHELVTNGADNAVRIKNTNATPFGLRITHSTDSNGIGNEFLYCAGAANLRASIRSNGGLANYSANNVNLSDINAKKDIALAAGTWDCLKEWEIVNFRYKDQPDDSDLNMGVIAQQIAESCPEVITVFQEAKEATETEPAQEERLGVKDQQMMWMAIKALQEAQLRIETLEAEVAALKAS